MYDDFQLVLIQWVTGPLTKPYNFIKTVNPEKALTPLLAKHLVLY